jgi:4-diphosphocytidyl-2-C-methyl-D-erythritol kinase
MILYPPAKINLGLHILAKRLDGYHEIETIMAAIPFCDILEITVADEDTFLQTGIEVPSDGQPNLCQRAVTLLRQQQEFPKVRIHLRKQIPVGAGLGGGSADASYTLLGLNALFNLSFSENELENFAAQLGSDCPFFIKGGLQLAKGRGERLQPLLPIGREVQLVLCNPQIHVSTAQAYAGVNPTDQRASLKAIFESKDIGGLQNDFEKSIFEKFTPIAQLKAALHQAGAFYAAMSGSGSSVFALFEMDADLNLPREIDKYIIYKGSWRF